MNTTSSLDVYSSKDYKRSRGAYCIECAFEYFVSLLVGGSFLAKLLGNIGMDTNTIGIVSSIISLAFLFQLLALFVAHRITNTKRFVIIFHFLSQMLFMSLYLIPFLGIASKYKQIIAIGCILLAYFGNYFVTSMIYRWGNSYVDHHKRGSYGATKEMISLISGMVVTIGIGIVMDSFDAKNDIYGGFVFAAIGIFVFALCDLVCLLLIKNDIKPKEQKRERVAFSDVIKNTLGNKNYRNVIILTVIYNVGIYTTIGFMGAYKLQLFEGIEGVWSGVDPINALFWIELINNAGILTRFAVSKPFGRFSDRTSYARGISLAMIIGAVAFFINIFAAPKLWFLIIPFTMLFNAIYAGSSANLLNITYSYVDEKYFVQASAIKNSIGGLCGFIAALVAGQVVGAMGDGGQMILGMRVFAPQILSAFSCLCFVGAFLFTKLVIEKQKIIEE